MTRDRDVTYFRWAALLTAFLYPAGYAAIGFGLLFFGGLWRLVRRRSIVWRRSPIDLPLAVFGLILLVSAACSPYHRLALAITFMLIISGSVYFGSFVWLLQRDPAFTLKLLRAWGLGAFVAALTGLAHSATHYVQIYTHTGPAFIRARAEIPGGVGPNGLGTTLLLGSIVALGLAFSSHGRTRAWWTACGLTCLVGLLATGSRASLAGWVVGATYLVYRALRARPWWMAAVLAGGLVAVVLASTATPQLTARLRATISDVSSNRIRIWRTSLSMIQAHPALGTGFGTFERAYERQKGPGMSSEPFAFNLALNLAVETGLLGLLGALWVAVAAVHAWWYQGRRRPPPTDPMRAVVAALWIGLLVDQVADNTLFSISTSAGLWLLLALLVVPSRAIRADDGTEANVQKAEERGFWVRGESAMIIGKRWVLTAAVVVAAAVPWYTLRLFPLLTVGRATINVLDALAIVAVCLSLPGIIRDLLQRRRETVAVWGFLVYMLLPLALGIRSGHTFFAVREFRALSFYALALAFAARDHRLFDYRLWAWAYVAGATVAVLAVFAHLRWLTPLPGYPALIPKPVDFSGGFRVAYLDWTVPVIAIAFALGELLIVRARLAATLFAGVTCIVVGYVLVSAERFMQLVTLAISAIVGPVFAVRTRRAPRLVALAMFLVVGAVALHVAGVSEADNVLKGAAVRWLHWHGDGSLSFRLRETEAGMAALRNHFPQSLLLGEGLGEVVHVAPFRGQSEIAWPYFSTGYSFLLFHTGLVGLGLYLFMTTNALLFSARRLGEDFRGGGWPVAAYGMIGLLAVLLLNVLYPAADVPEGAVAFSLCYGMAYSTKRCPRSQGGAQHLDVRENESRGSLSRGFEEGTR